MKLLEKFKVTTLLIVLIACFNITGAEVFGQNCYNRYVSTQGSNANDGTQNTPYQTIQYAIDQACVGNTVFVEEGTYVENIDFKGKDIVVTSLNCPELTIIDGNQNGSVVTFRNGETNNAVLNGFTITNGNANNNATKIDIYGFGWVSVGGGILVYQKTSPTLENLIVENNTAELGGGIGVAFNWGGVLKTIIRNCHINNNSAVESGGGLLSIAGSKIIVSNSAFYRNTAQMGSAISSNYTSYIDLYNNTISNNTASQNGAIHLANASKIQAKNSIIWENTPSISNIFWEGGTTSTSTVNYSCVENGGAGANITWGSSNIYSSPQFTDSSNDDYSLLNTSPCVDTGMNTNAPPTDINGTVRPQGNGIDMGAYETGGTPMNSCCSYAIRTDNIDCVRVGDTLCVWLDAIKPIPSNVTGLDYCLHYDPTHVTPLNPVNASLGNLVTSGGNAAYFGFIDTPNNNVHTSIYYQGNGNFDTTTGEVVCIEFVVNSLPPSGDIPFEVCEVRESYPVGILNQCANDGIITLLQPERDGQLIYWNYPNHLIDGTSNLTTQTDVLGNDSNCNNTGDIYSVDVFGYFKTTSEFIDINRQIVPDDFNTGVGACVPVAPTLTSFDCACLGLITTFNTMLPACNGNGGIPTAFQMLAGDVNMDDVLSAGDVSAIQQRIIENTCEYPQAWNYDLTGTPLLPYFPSKDWRFVDAITAMSSDYMTHSNYPNFPPTVGSGYWRDEVPDIPECLPTYVDSCYTDTLLYHGILLGDIDGSWQTNQSLKKAVTVGQLVLEVENLIVNEDNNTYQIPVRINSQEIIYALDLTIEYDPEILTVEDVKNTPQAETDQFNTAFNTVDNRLLLSSYTLKGSQTDEALFYVTVRLNNESILQYEDLGNVKVLLNGVDSEVVTTFVNINTPLNDVSSISVYPNPVRDRLNIQWKISTYTTKSVRLFNALGQLVAQAELNTQEQQVNMDVSFLEKGIYFMSIYEDGVPIGSTKILK